MRVQAAAQGSRAECHPEPAHLCLHAQLSAGQPINCCRLLQRHHVAQQHVEAVGGEGGIVGAHHPLEVAAWQGWTEEGTNS